MNKIYTSVLCMVLLAPTLARAEICTDFDDNMNIIEFDCAEGIENARKRIASEQEKVRAAAEKAAIEHEKQRKAEEKAKRDAERLAEDLRKTEKRLEKEKAKRQALEKTKTEAKLIKERRWKYVAGLGVSGWMGPSVTSDAFHQEQINEGTIYNASYDASGFSLNPSLGLRYYFLSNLDWYAQLNLGYATTFEHSLDFETVEYDCPAGWYCGTPDTEGSIKTEEVVYIDVMLGHLIGHKTYLYGRLGLMHMNYEIEKWPEMEGEIDDPFALMLGIGVEYAMWQQTSFYLDANYLTTVAGQFVEGETFLMFNAGVRYMF